MYVTQQNQLWRLGSSSLKSELNLIEFALSPGGRTDHMSFGPISWSGIHRNYFFNTWTEMHISSSPVLPKVNPASRTDYYLEKYGSSSLVRREFCHAEFKFTFEYQLRKLNKTVILKPVVNPGIPKTLYCKGLFTTTHAKILRTISMALPSVILGCEARCTNRGWLGRLPDRDSGPGSIGIGLAPSSRAFLDKFKNLSTIVLSNVIPRLPVYEKRCFQVNSNCGHSLLIWFNRILKDFNNLHGQLRLRLNAFLKKLSMREYNHGHGGLFSIFNNHLTSTLNWRTCLGIM
jgi:hypothetical protein